MVYIAPAWRCTDCAFGFDYVPADGNCPHHCGGVLIPQRDIDLELDRGTQAGRIRLAMSNLDAVDKFNTEDLVEAVLEAEDEAAIDTVPRVFVPLSTLKLWLQGYTREWRVQKKRPSLHASLAGETWAESLHDEMVALAEQEASSGDA